MLTAFDDIKIAEEFCDKIHKYLQKNCPNYSAEIWQKPIELDKKFYVALPKEFEKDYYETKEKISVTLKTVTDKSSLTITDKDYKALTVSKA
jgi:hypothetical protein